MDSLKMFKGYGKLEHDQHHLEDQQYRNSPKPKSSKPFVATLSILAILFLTFTLAFAIASLIHHTTAESQQLLDSAESIRVVCNVTRFPDACLAAIAPSRNATDPLAILALSLRASIHALRSLASAIGATEGRAVADCRDQLDDGLSRLNDSLSAAAALTDARVADVQTWVSAAATDQQTCLDGLEEVGDVAALKEVKNLMKRSTEYTSNSLAIVANIHNLLRQFHMTLH
ncbi:Pectinesterase 3 [Spatholobus suberectus]|nr:Pectinesterase 3 [Spatholobus suberectus]